MLNNLTRYFGWSQFHHWYEFGTLALCVLLPMLVPGYILTLDMVFTPNIALPAEVSNTWLLQVVLWIVHFILPMDVIEKVILFTILICSGAGMYRLFVSLQSGRDTSLVGAYFAGLFYMINPFVYSRFMAGQWMVLLGYALLPFCIRSFYLFAQSPSVIRAFRVALWLFLILSVSLHMSGIAFIAMVVLFITASWGIFDRRYAKGLFVIIAVPMVLSSFWLFPALFGIGSIGESVASFTKDHFAAFETVGGVGAILRLQGFWVEVRDLYVLPQMVVPLWGVWFVALWLLVISGIRRLIKVHRSLAVGVLVCMAIGMTASTTPIIQWVGQFIPVVAGYREPHKFVSLVAFSFAIFGGAGVAWTVAYWRKKHSEISSDSIKVGMLLLPIIITPVMFWGFSGQLMPRTYPSEWYQTNEILKEQAGQTKTLFLPWHQYANYSFSGRIIANPSEKFFETPIIASDEPEYKNLGPTRPNSLKQAMSAILRNRRDLSEELSRRGVGFIVLAKEQDYREYAYLDNDPGLTVIQDNAKLKLYKVK